MTDVQFLDHAEQLLQRVEACCDAINESGISDIDNQRSGGMVTLEFSNRSQIVINLQKPLHEVWLAARSGGYHYRLNSGQWLDTKGSGAFFEKLSACSSEQAGCVLTFDGAASS